MPLNEVNSQVLPLPEASLATPPHQPLSFPPIPLDEPPSVLRRGAQPRLSRSHRIPKHASKLEYLHLAMASLDTGAGVRFKRKKDQSSRDLERKHVRGKTGYAARDFVEVKRKGKSSRVNWVCADCGHLDGQWWGLCRLCHSLGMFNRFSEVNRGQRHAEEDLAATEYGGGATNAVVGRQLGNQSAGLANSFIFKEMDARVFYAIAGNYIPSFIRLVQEDEGILDKRLIGSLNTVLHLASKYGQVNLVREIIKLRPEMAAAENKKLETLLHEACRQGDIEVVMLLLKTNPWLSCNFNSKNQSALFITCSNGNLKVVKFLRNQPWFVGIDEDEAQLNSLHVAASNGYADIVGHNKDVNGYSPLHYACSKGHVSIATMLLKFDLNLTLQFDNIGYTPLHLAAMNGDLAILQEFVALALASSQFLTTCGEAVFYLAARFNHYIAFIYLATVFCDTYLFHQPDRFGNTILHIAISGRHYHV
ncbi:hypothetical protein LWI29_006739 [Acer saccharum]|uniref:Uncharacterized protein n=1 Tax=Acer saccharum TaxID=4024 RepID=A0AA39VR42_ACESA|nr:hypothetical protein LWI29_006739 [Acer saccharum]